MNRKILVSFWLIILASAPSFSKSPASFETGTRKTDLDVVNEFLTEFTASSLWGDFLDTAPIYGNYCTVETVKDDFESACLNKLDCICKARHFANDIKKYRKTDQEFLKTQLGIELEEKGYDPNWGLMKKIMTTKLFASRIVGVNVSEGIKSVISLYEKDRQKSFLKLKEIIDENEIFRRKIEEIRVEQIRFEERENEDSIGKEQKSKSMSVSVQPFNLIFGLFLLNWESRISDIFSVRIGSSIYATGLITDTYLGYGNNNKNFSAFFIVGLKSFFSGKTLSSGMYLEPNLEIGYENVARNSDPSIRDRDIAFVPAMFFGMEKVFSSGFQVDLGFGGGCHAGVPLSDEPFSTIFFVPKIRAAIGFAW